MIRDLAPTIRQWQCIQLQKMQLSYWQGSESHTYVNMRIPAMKDQEFSIKGMTMTDSPKCKCDFPSDSACIFFFCVVLIVCSGLLCTVFLDQSQYHIAESYTTVGCPACSCSFPGKQIQPSCSFNPLWVWAFMSHLPPMYTLHLLFMPLVYKNLKQANRLLTSHGPVVWPYLLIPFSCGCSLNPLLWNSDDPN